MHEVVVVEAVRTPFGKRGGGLSGMHSVDLLGAAVGELFVRSGVDAASVGQVVGGCVLQIGMQAMNVTRQAWLAAGLPSGVASSTVDSQCGSSQQAVNIAYALVAGGVVDTAVACGVEVMSRVPMGSTVPADGSLGKPINRSYWAHHEFTTQFEAAERIAAQWQITRDDCDHFGMRSQDFAAAAQSGGRFDSQLVQVKAPVPGSDGETQLVSADEGLRVTSLEKLAGLQPTGRADGVHTAGTSSQISDGASAILLMSADRARHLGLTPMATMVSTCLVGTDPALMLTGPMDATRKLLGDAGLQLADIDLFEINEAFASVVLSWAKELDVDMARVNPNGGAIALGHPLGATGCGLIAKAVHELASSDGEHALVSMCCGGGLGTGSLLRRA